MRRFGALDFPALRDGIQIKSDGNLANHLRVLEDLELIEYKKEFVDRKPKTFYRLTPGGKEIFQSLLRHFKDFSSDV
ncbi:MAG: transcriptional regulator [Nitrosopumilaceae archaeon]|nr:transcriptional regulator [Nitrosopumilaceae archaeon]